MTRPSSRRWAAAALLLLALLGTASARPLTFGGGFGGGLAGFQGSAQAGIGQQQQQQQQVATGGAPVATTAAQQQQQPQFATFVAHLSGANQVPMPVASQATALATIQLDLVNQVGAWTLTARNVVNFTMAHIHMGNAATNGAPIVLLAPGAGTAAPSGVVGTLPMTAPTNLPFAVLHGTLNAGSLITTDAAVPPPSWAQFVQLLQSGNAYANIHTTAFPAGEIRGQYAPSL